jgi:quinol monooxygenase YgiN
MYGLIGQIEAIDGGREELAAILTQPGAMPGCLLYEVANDRENANALRVTQVCDSAQAHADSLSLPVVQEAISNGKPLIAGVGTRIETDPIGGIGLG